MREALETSQILGEVHMDAEGAEENAANPEADVKNEPGLQVQISWTPTVMIAVGSGTWDGISEPDQSIQMLPLPACP